MNVSDQLDKLYESAVEMMFKVSTEQNNRIVDSIILAVEQAIEKREDDNPLWQSYIKRAQKLSARKGFRKDVQDKEFIQRFVKRGEAIMNHKEFDPEQIGRIIEAASPDNNNKLQDKDTADQSEKSDKGEKKSKNKDKDKDKDFRRDRENQEVHEHWPAANAPDNSHVKNQHKELCTECLRVSIYYGPRDFGMACKHCERSPSSEGQQVPLVSEAEWDHKFDKNVHKDGVIMDTVRREFGDVIFFLKNENTGEYIAASKG